MAKFQSRFDAIRAIDANFCKKMPNDMKYFLMFSDLEYLIYLESY